MLKRDDPPVLSYAVPNTRRFLGGLWVAAAVGFFGRVGTSVMVGHSKTDADFEFAFRLEICLAIIAGAVGSYFAPRHEFRAGFLTALGWGLGYAALWDSQFGIHLSSWHLAYLAHFFLNWIAFVLLFSIRFGGPALLGSLIVWVIRPRRRVK